MHVVSVLTHVLGGPSCWSLDHVEVAQFVPRADAAEVMSVNDRAVELRARPHLASLMAIWRGLLGGLPLAVKRLAG